MSQIILDFGSGNTCQNSLEYTMRMIDELNSVDTRKHEVIIKWQLFEKAGQNVRLNLFDFAYNYAKRYNYKTTASVFDLASLMYLLEYGIPFVKIANNRSLDWLIGEVPREIPAYVSVGAMWEITAIREYGWMLDHDRLLCCVSKYPADSSKYMSLFNNFLNSTISDHTVGLELFKKYTPGIWEKHYKLPDSTGLDAGPFAITPEELKEIL